MSQAAIPATGCTLSPTRTHLGTWATRGEGRGGRERIQTALLFHNTQDGDVGASSKCPFLALWPSHSHPSHHHRLGRDRLTLRPRTQIL